MGKSLNQGFETHKISLILTAALPLEMPKFFSEFSYKIGACMIIHFVYSFQQFLNDISNQLLTLVEL